MIYGINSNIKSKNFLKYKLFKPFKIIPTIICITPKMTANFILNELIKTNSFPALTHIGSIPLFYLYFKYRMGRYNLIYMDKNDLLSHCFYYLHLVNIDPIYLDRSMNRKY